MVPVAAEAPADMEAEDPLWAAEDPLWAVVTWVAAIWVDIWAVMEDTDLHPLVASAAAVDACFLLSAS